MKSTENQYFKLIEAYELAVYYCLQLGAVAIAAALNIQHF